MARNTVKEKLSEGKAVVGIFVSTSDPRLVELCGYAGFDYVVIDAEHTPISERECENLVRACEVVGLVPIVRVPDNSPKIILRYLDVGALGIMVPQVRSPKEATAAVEAAHYAPLGSRGLASGRLSGYGSQMGLSEYVEMVNQETMVIVQIEHRDAVDHLEKILAVEGIDAFEMGQADLSQSLGMPGNSDHPQVQEYVNRAIDTILGAGRILGDTTTDPEAAADLLDKGFRMVACHLNKIILQGGNSYLAPLRSKITSLVT